MSEVKELELTPAQIERNDDIDNTVYDCICTLVEKNIPWDMAIIGECTDALKRVLKKFDLTVRHPGILENEDGTTQEYSE